MKRREETVPVYVLSGFLGSGKTTLLKRWLLAAEADGRKPAVVMNELGDVNLDGMQLGGEVKMAEMLGGCICCTVRGDLGMEMLKLLDEHDPDVLLIESTGAANPLDIIDAITDASMLTRVELKQVVTVVDAPHLREQAAKSKGATFRLMREQTRCATVLLLNKTDLLSEADADELERTIREWNGFAPIHRTVAANIPIAELENAGRGRREQNGEDASGSVASTPSCECGHPHEPGRAHHTHEHVMALTRYFDGPIDSESFEAMMASLPDGVYRAKGILSFTDTSSRFMFQYAYKQLDLMKIAPQGDVPDVAVFIGEHFDKTELEERLDRL
ncbi:CobW family GTP-binding protein [Paenibacillus flagellatus]|uniref:GTP-binding protein n=1 Tax=Paenibacillus flagellatus TaxID=2211139 RepID=A0A2V5KDB5_9BACL|nr:GTP-binding protein [Paenibacillus flagellatus]PYI56882.1 GTP-binding protein [Paenibacillus flagellatus]